MAPADGPPPPGDSTICIGTKASAAEPRLVVDGGAYVTLCGSDMSRGEEQNEGEQPLAGWRFAVKDLIAVAGQPLRAGSAVREEVLPEPGHAPVVAALLSAGARLVGLTALHEFAFGVTGINDIVGTPCNPRDPSRIPGGSSSGSAVAVAEGSVCFALGTDTGGSVRIPAALCGVVGFKPKFDTYSTDGVFPLSPTLDHVGLLASCVDVIQQVHSVLAPPIRGERRPLRVGVLSRQIQQCDPVVRAQLTYVLERLEERGIELTTIDAEWPSEEESLEISTTIMFAEAADVHRGDLERHAARFGADVRERLQQGLAIPAVQYLSARRAQKQLRRRVRDVLTRIDCVVGPTVGLPAPPLATARDPAVGRRLVTFTRLANLTGSAALSLPIPEGGPPAGLHIIADDNERVLTIGAFVEKAIRT